MNVKPGVFVTEKGGGFKMTPYDLYHNLGALAMEAALGEAIQSTNYPAMLKPFILAWSRRTVNLLMLLECSGYGKEHTGLHLHDDRLFCNEAMLSGEDEEGDTGEKDEVEDLETKMAEMQDKMGQTSMEDAVMGV